MSMAGEESKPRMKITPDFSMGSLASILSILVSAVSVTAYVGKIEARVDVNTTEITATQRQQREFAADQAARDAENIRRQERLEDKLDRITMIITRSP